MAHKRKRLKYFVVVLSIFLGVFLLASVIALAFTAKKPENAPEQVTVFPELRIRLNDVTLKEIISNDKEIKYSGNEVDYVTDAGTQSFANVEIKGRGNSTWGLPKSPFQIKFEQKVNLLKLGESKKWVLLANYIDDSGLRDDVAFKIANMIGEKYAMKGDFVRLFVDDEDQGLYYLAHKVEISKQSVDLRDPYGILMEIDNLHRTTEECVESEVGVCFIVKDAVMKDDEVVFEESVEQFMTAYNEFEAAVREGNFEEIVKMIDVRSFAEYYLINEFTVNPDAYCSSFYLYKDGESDKIHAGPVWDFDYALGNRNWIWGSDDSVLSPYRTMALRSTEWREGAKVGNYVDIYYLMEMPEFRNEVRRLYKTKLSGKGEEVVNWLKKRRDYIAEYAVLDAEMWEFGDFEAETEYLIDWVEKRFEYFERVYGREEFFQ